MRPSRNEPRRNVPSSKKEVLPDDLREMRELVASLAQSGELAEYDHRIARLILPNIRLKTAPTAEMNLNIGASKFGGVPDLPEPMMWPRKSGKPFAFLCQINLGELPPVLRGFPRKGLLSFFLDMHAFDDAKGKPRDHDSWRVLYFSDEGLVHKRVVPPADLSHKFAAAAITPTAGFSLPPFESREVEGLDLGVCDVDPYFSLLDKFHEAQGMKESEPHHWLGGYPDQLGGDVRLECALAEAGFWKGSDDWSEQQDERALADAGNWRLLLQVDSSPDDGMDWSGGGMLYFGARAVEINAGHFDKAQLVSQSAGQGEDSIG
ncbi:MAG: YwqG family protein [Candidatus Brocadiia bacterium]